jgi:hypothetical protein
MTVFWDVAAYSLVEINRRFQGCLLSPSSGRIDLLIALMMETVSSSETSVSIQTTRRSIPKDSYLHTRRRENLNSQLK